MAPHDLPAVQPTGAHRSAAPAHAIHAVRDVDGLVGAAVAQAMASSDEVGLQVAVVMDGEVVVDVTAGLADREAGQLVDSHTLFPFFSATKGVVATAVLQASDRQWVDLNAPIASYWPELAGGGKEAATVVDLLTHAVGIPQMPDPCTVEQMCDWERMVAAVAALPALWRPGTESGYHAYTFGWLAGGLLERVVPGHPPLGAQVRALLEPVGADELWIGLPGTREPEVATLYAPAGTRPPGPTELFDRALPPALRPQPSVFNSPAVHAACLPAAGGIGTAISLARLYDALAHDVASTAGAGRLLRPETARLATRVWTAVPDAVLGQPVRKGLGYFIGGGGEAQTAAMGPEPAFGHPGSGGSTAFADVASGAGIAIVKNWMTPPADPAILTVAAAARAAARRRRHGAGQ